MANVIDSVSIRGLRKSHFKQLIGYLEEQEREGWYCGNRAQFQKRHQDLVHWIRDINHYLKNYDVRIAK